MEAVHGVTVGYTQYIGTFWKSFYVTCETGIVISPNASGTIIRSNHYLIFVCTYLTLRLLIKEKLYSVSKAKLGRRHGHLTVRPHLPKYLVVVQELQFIWLAVALLNAHQSAIACV